MENTTQLLIDQLFRLHTAVKAFLRVIYDVALIVQ